MRSVDSFVTPVMLPPGRATPSTRPVATGSRGAYDDGYLSGRGGLAASAAG